MSTAFQKVIRSKVFVNNSTNALPPTPRRCADSTDGLSQSKPLASGCRSTRFLFDKLRLHSPPNVAE